MIKKRNGCILRADIFQFVIFNHSNTDKSKSEFLPQNLLSSIFDFSDSQQYPNFDKRKLFALLWLFGPAFGSHKAVSVEIFIHTKFEIPNPEGDYEFFSPLFIGKNNVPNWGDRLIFPKQQCGFRFSSECGCIEAIISCWFNEDACKVGGDKSFKQINAKFGQFCVGQVLKDVLLKKRFRLFVDLNFEHFKQRW